MEKGVKIQMEFNARSYIGDLRDDKPEGLGILYDTCGKRYVG